VDRGIIARPKGPQGRHQLAGRTLTIAGKHISLLVHFVWSTAGREPWITSEYDRELYNYIGGVFRYKNAVLLSAGGMSDHIHLYASLPSTLSLAQIVNAAK